MIRQILTSHSQEKSPEDTIQSRILTNHLRGDKGHKVEKVTRTILHPGVNPIVLRYRKNRQKNRNVMTRIRIKVHQERTRKVDTTQIQIPVHREELGTTLILIKVLRENPGERKVNQIPT